MLLSSAATGLASEAVGLAVGTSYALREDALIATNKLQQDIAKLFGPVLTAQARIAPVALDESEDSTPETYASLGDALTGLWSGLSLSIQTTGTVIQDNASNVGDGVSDGMETNPAGTLIALPLTVSAALLDATAQGRAAGWYLAVDTVGDSVDGLGGATIGLVNGTIQTLLNDSAAGTANLAAGLAGLFAPKTASLARGAETLSGANSVVGAAIDLRTALSSEQLRIRWESDVNLLDSKPGNSVASSVNNVLAAVETGKPKAVLNTVAVQRQALRDNVATYDKDGKLNGGSVKNVRDAADKARGTATKAVTDKLPGELKKAAESASKQADNLRSKVRDGGDKVASNVKKAGDSVTKKVRNATD